MPKTITNPLREGLPSKIYLLAYNGPVSGYEVAQKIQGLKHGKVPQTSKVYGWIKEMKKKGLLRDSQGGGYLSNVEPLVKEISQVLTENNDIVLSDLECYMIGKILDEDSFRNLVEFSYYHKKSFFKGEVDATHEIMEVLGDHAMHTFALSDNFPTIRGKSEFDALWNENTALTVEPISIKDKLRDKIPELLTTLENDKKWHDARQLAQALDLAEEDMKEITAALIQSSFIETEGNKVRIKENSPQELMFLDEESQKRIEQFSAEENYFKRTGKLKPGGIYEQMYRQGQLDVDGKKIKQWAFPIHSNLLPKTLIEKLCKLSSTYHLFQTLRDGKISRLYAMWSNKKLAVCQFRFVNEPLSFSLCF